MPPSWIFTLILTFSHQERLRGRGGDGVRGRRKSYKVLKEGIFYIIARNEVTWQSHKPSPSS
jgi:hypothetical protein